MRLAIELFIFVILTMVSVAFAENSAEPKSSMAKPTWPFWDGQETNTEYARRTGLAATKTLDLGNGVKLDLVLIPAGKFIMGTPEPESPWIGGAILVCAVLVMLAQLAVPVVRAVRRRRRPQFSLRWLILLVVVVGVVQYGGFRWWRATEARDYFDSNETPAHEVTLTQPYYLSKYEVTQEQYRQVLGKNPNFYNLGSIGTSSYVNGPTLPVEMVEWNEAQEFCQKGSEESELTVRLPTEAEWEYACRAGTLTFYNSDAARDQAAWSGNLHPVGQQAPNNWGVHDMHGNVGEWCQDWYGDYPEKQQTDPRGPAQGEYRVERGAFINFYSPKMPIGKSRSAFRSRDHQGSRRSGRGFRVAALVPGIP